MKKNAALLRFLAFLLLDHNFGVLRGEQPLSRASRAVGSSGHFFRFLFWCPKRKDYRKYAMILEGLPQGGNPDAAKKLKRRIHRCRNRNLRRPSGQLP